MQYHSAEAILESLTHAFFSLGSDWRFTYLNQQANVLLGANLANCWAKRCGTNILASPAANPSLRIILITIAGIRCIAILRRTAYGVLSQCY